MKQILSMIQDGEGNTSAMRVITLLVVACVVIPPVVIALKTGGTVQWSSGDMEMIGIALGGKLVQNVHENKATTETPKVP